MFVNGKHLAKLIEQQFPQHFAESWDNVGFLVGSPNARVEKVMTALELTPEVLEEAIEKNADLIVVHHPLIFKPLKQITDETEVGNLVKELIKHKITLYAAHTNLDTGFGGTSHYFADLLELEDQKPLSQTHQTSYLKLVTYVPKEQAQVVADAIAHAGGGQIGNYDNCHFMLEGTGLFRPLDGANPFIGEVGALERVEEVRIETIVPKPSIKAVITELLKTHPYEVPAYDLVPIENVFDSFGIGVMGTLKEGLPFEALCDLVKRVFDVQVIRGVNVSKHAFRQIAICTGAGAEYIQEAARQGCEVLITGDLKYHEAQLARSLRLSVIDVGHYESEAPYMRYFAQWLTNQCDKKGYEVKVVASEIDANPLKVF